MTANAFFEIYNHFLSTKDSGQVIKFASDLKCFRSESFGDGTFFYGAEAPSAFRLTLNEILRSKTTYEMEVVGRAGTENSAVFVVNLMDGSQGSKSVLSIGIAKQQLVYFVETLT